MDIIALILILFVALFHIQVFVLESLLWETPRAMKVFGTTPHTVRITRPLAVNQGVYNLFLSAGLIWSLTLSGSIALQAKLFFLLCVIIAALTAGIVVNKRIMFIQGTPALLAVIAVLIAY